MQLPLFQLEIDEFDDETGMFLISMVESPAMRVAAVLLAEQQAGFKVGDTVMVIPGKEHMSEHKDMMFTVYEVVGNAYALQMPDGKIHRWYTADELMSMTDEAMKKKKMPGMKMSELVTLKTVNEKKRYLTSAVIIPDKLIFRSDERRGDYNIQFTADQIEKIRNKFFQSTGNLRLSNKNHVESDLVQAQLIESWIIDDPKMDKATALGFDLPKGTMMATYQITDEQFWNEQVLTGNVTGFSLEGRFTEAEVKLMEEESAFQELMKLLDELEG